MISIPIKISNVGMTSDGFDRASSSMRSIVHFDPTSYPDQLVPHRSSENGDTSASTNKIGSFVYANDLLYGLSFETGSSQKLYAKNDMTTQTWPTSPSNMSVSAAYIGQPIDYHGALYLFQAGQFDAYTYAASRRDANISTLSVGIIAAVVHSKDDTLYLASSTTVYRSTSTVGQNPVTASATSIVVPKNLTIVSLCEYGNFLAIGCAPTNGYGKSIIFLWDRDSSLTTLTESIDLGNRNLVIIEQIEGQIIAISYNTANSFGARITFQSYDGGQPKIFKELISTTTYTIGDLVPIKQKVGERLYFLLTITLNGTKLQGVWRVSRPSPTSPLTVSIDYLPNNDTALTSGTLNGHILVGDYAFISYVSSSAYGMSKTDDQANYTATSYIESCINPRMSDGDYYKKKQLTKFGVNFSPLSSGQQVVAKYRVDGGSWKTIFTKTFTTPTTETTDYTSNRDSTGQFDQGTFYEFRLESTGGAVIVGYTYEYGPVAQPQ